MTIGIRLGSKRVNGARIRQYGKAGGARSGEQAGLGSTIGKPGWMINWIKRRVNRRPSKSEQLSNLISSGVNLLTLAEMGFTLNNLVEALGFFGTADFIFKSFSNTKDLFKYFEISDSAFENAGAVDKGNGELDFSNFSVKSFLTRNPNVRPTQILSALERGLKNENITRESIKSSNGNDLPLAIKLSVAKEFYGTYNNFSESQKINFNLYLTSIHPSIASRFAIGTLNSLISLSFLIG